MGLLGHSTSVITRTIGSHEVGENGRSFQSPTKLLLGALKRTASIWIDGSKGGFCPDYQQMENTARRSFVHAA